jgi:hypothetical protein
LSAANYALNLCEPAQLSRLRTCARAPKVRARFLLLSLAINRAFARGAPFSELRYCAQSSRNPITGKPLVARGRQAATPPLRQSPR